MEQSAFHVEMEGPTPPGPGSQTTLPSTVSTSDERRNQSVEEVKEKEEDKEEGEGRSSDDVKMEELHADAQPEKVPASDAVEASLSDDSALEQRPPAIATGVSKDESPAWLPQSSYSMPYEYPPVHLKLRRKPGRSFKPALQTKYLNNLMLIVGFLELTNALDFPANVWNMTPVPRFAVGLMATGGSVAILASFLAFYDLSKSVTNYRLLAKERVYLMQEKRRWAAADDSRRADMTDAWLDVNLREARWEAAERMMMDSLNGFAGIIVGIGTILAVDGANPVSFDASNLLSGYIGNSFNVVYGAFNTAFAIYMYIRSRAHSKVVGQALPGGAIKQWVLGYLRRHRTYAIVNGITVFVSAIGGMVSAKNWQGYVVLLPCVFGAVFCNLFWRHLVGYDRDFCQWRPDAVDLNPEKELLFAIDAIEVVKAKAGHNLLEKKAGIDIVLFMTTHGMREDFAARVLHDLGEERQVLLTGRQKHHIELTLEQLSRVDEEVLIRSAGKTIDHVGYHRFRDQARMLAELWGSQLAASQESRHLPAVNPDQPTKEEV